MPYGILKVDTITFTNGGADQNITVSGIVASTSGNLTVTGTVLGNVIRGSTTVSGATVTGGAGQFTTVTGGTAGFTTVTGTTVTGTTANFVSGVFTTRISGATVTGNTGQFTTLTGGTAGFTTVTGTTVTGTTASFTTGNFINIGSNATLTDPIIVGTITEDVYTITDGAAFEVNPANGSVQLITLGASRTPKATSFAAGEAVTMMVDDGTAYTLTWTDATWGGTGVVWKTDSGLAPMLNTSGYTAITLWKVSTQVYGARVGNA